MSLRPTRDVDAKIGERIRHLRKAGKHSQVELGAKVGMPYQQIQKYESGANRVSAAMLLAISKALNVPVSSFYPDNCQNGGAT